MYCRRVNIVWYEFICNHLYPHEICCSTTYLPNIYWSIAGEYLGAVIIHILNKQIACTIYPGGCVYGMVYLKYVSFVVYCKCNRFLKML